MKIRFLSLCSHYFKRSVAMCSQLFSIGRCRSRLAPPCGSEMAPLAMCWHCHSSLRPECVQAPGTGRTRKGLEDSQLPGWADSLRHLVKGRLRSSLGTAVRSGEDEQGALRGVRDLLTGTTFLGDEPDLGMNPTG